MLLLARSRTMSPLPLCIREARNKEPTHTEELMMTTVNGAGRNLSIAFIGRPKGLPQNKVYHSTLSVAARRDRIVPLWVLVVWSDVQVFHLLVADFDPGLVPAFV